jgi:hypothetical protein
MNYFCDRIIVNKLNYYTFVLVIHLGLKTLDRIDS